MNPNAKKHPSYPISGSILPYGLMDSLNLALVLNKGSKLSNQEILDRSHVVKSIILQNSASNVIEIAEYLAVPDNVRLAKCFVDSKCPIELKDIQKSFKFSYTAGEKAIIAKMIEDSHEFDNKLSPQAASSVLNSVSGHDDEKIVLKALNLKTEDGRPFLFDKNSDIEIDSKILNHIVAETDSLHLVENRIGHKNHEKLFPNTPKGILEFLTKISE